MFPFAIIVVELPLVAVAALLNDRVVRVAPDVARWRNGNDVIRTQHRTASLRFRSEAIGTPARILEWFCPRATRGNICS